MQLSHRFIVPARVDDAWTAFNRISRVAPCFPGAKIDSISGDDFSGSIKIKFGPILLLYNGSGRIVERVQAERRLRIEAKGRDRRGQGSATVTLTAWFSELGRGTEVRAETNLTLTGRPAQFGQALITEVVDRILERFVHCVGEQLATRGPAAPIAKPDLEPANDPMDLEPVAAVSLADPAVDDADFATAPTPPRPDPEPDLTPVDETEPEPEFVAETIDPMKAPELPEPTADETIDADFRTDVEPGAVVLRPDPTPVPTRSTGPAALRKYAPAVSAAVAAGVAVVVWAVGRRRR